MRIRMAARMSDPIRSETYITMRFGTKRRPMPPDRGATKRGHFNQDGRCAICGIFVTLEKVSLAEKKKRAHLDHDHLTGKKRGILCGHCNLMLGFAQDDLKILWMAIMYLMHFKRITLSEPSPSPLPEQLNNATKMRPDVRGIRKCKVEGCGNSMRCLDLCGKHYARWRKTGDPVKTPTGQQWGVRREPGVRSKRMQR